MKYTVAERLATKVVVSATFSGAEVEAFATRRAINMLGDVYDPAHAGLKSNVALLSALPQFESIMKLALQDAYQELLPQVVEQERFVPLDAPFLQLTDGDFAGQFDVVFTIPVAENLQSIAYEGLDVRFHPVIAQGDEVDKRIADVCAQYEVAGPDELLAKTKLYGSVDEMRKALEGSLGDFVESLKAKSKRDAVCEALLRANRFDVPAAMVEGYVDREIAQMVGQIGQEMYQEHLKLSGRDEAGFREEVAKKVTDLARLDVILDAIAARLPREVDDAERLEKIEEQRKQALDPSREEDADTVLGQLRGQPNVLHSLDDAIRRDRAVDYVAQLATFKELAPMTLDEYLRYQRTAGPLF